MFLGDLIINSLYKNLKKDSCDDTYKKQIILKNKHRTTIKLTTKFRYKITN